MWSVQHLILLTVRQPKKDRMYKKTGFTLIEVLIAMLIMSLGLLGLAALQAIGLRNNQSAYHRSQATQLAYDMADRIRANVAEANNGAASTYITQDPASATEQANCATVSGMCTPVNIAENDLYLWNAAISNSNILPLGVGSITVNGTVFSIIINWDDNHDGVVDSDSSNAIPDDPNFQMNFRL